MPRLCSSLLLSLLIASSASAVTMAWTPIGDPGNAADSTGFGAIGYAYSIGTYEVTNAEYAEFLNAKAASDPLGLYDTDMANTATNFRGGITRTGSWGSYAYTAIAGRESMPVNFVSFYDALRFANWMNNGQGSSDTETGAYTLLGGTAIPSNGATVTRNAGATIYLTSEDEWYKAAYYDAVTTSYFDFPTGAATEPTCAAPTAAINRANCILAVGDLTNVGSYPGSASPYGTFDQAGNLQEWNESIIDGTLRGLRGGSFNNLAGMTSALARNSTTPQNEDFAFGFRIAMIPEPGTGLLVFAGLLGLAGWRKTRA